MGRRSRIAAATIIVMLAALLVGPMSVPASADTGLPCGITSVTAGYYNSFAIAGGGTVYGWGDNMAGQLGDGTTTHRYSAVQVPGLTGITAISSGYQHTLAVGPGGVVYAWGSNSHGQLGDGTTINRPNPTQVPGLSGITAVSAGHDFSLALAANGTVYAWGYNYTGQVGNGSTTDRHTPLALSLTGITAISAGGAASLAVGTGGTVYGWGSNMQGQLGDGTSIDRFTPVQVPGLSGITAVATTSGGHSIALGAGGTVYGWGRNDYGQVGDGTTTTRYSPVQLSGIAGMTHIAANALTSRALGPGGTVYGWGNNNSGSLGDGTTAARYSPTAQGSGLSGITRLSGGSHGLALGAGGVVHAWGYNVYGQLGDGTTTIRVSPVQINCVTVPTATGASDTPDPVVAGNTVTFSVSWTDPNPSETARAVICKTNGVNAGTCTGGAWATGSTSASKPATATYSTTSSDVGTRTYYAFVCDSTNLCSSAITGTFTVNGSAPTATSVSDSPDPVVAGNPVMFSVGWTDSNPGEAVRAVICKTNAASAGSCPGGAWAIGSTTASTPATTQYYTSNATIGTNTYYAFVCDSAGLCSASLSGTFTVNGAVPTATSASDSPDPAVAGNPVTFSVNWADATWGEQVRPYICKTNAVSAGGCPGGAWAIGTMSAAYPATTSYTTTGADLGTRSYYAFVCDSINLCSNGVAGTFTVNPPACSDGADNDGDTKADFPNDPGCADPADNSEGPTCPPVTPGVVVCLTPGSVAGQYYLSYPTASFDGPEHGVAGYVDTYRFNIAGVTTTLACAQLQVDGTSANPCEAAGGTYVSRLATLVNTSVAEPTLQLQPLATVSVCNAELTATASGIGVDSAPAYALC